MFAWAFALNGVFLTFLMEWFADVAGGGVGMRNGGGMRNGSGDFPGVG